MEKVLLIGLALFAMSINLSVAVSHGFSVALTLILAYDLFINKKSISNFKTGYEWYFLFFVLACLASAIANYHLGIDVFKSFLQVRWILVFYVAFYLLKDCSSENIEKIIRIFLLVLALAGFYALFQYLTGIELVRPDRNLLEMPRPATHVRFRAIGFFNNPMTFGHSIAMGIPFAFSYFAYAFTKDKSKLLFASLVLAGISIGLFTSLTRGAYIAAFAGLVFTTFLMRKRFIIYPFLGLIALVFISYLLNSELYIRIYTIFQKTNSLISRVEIWSAYFEMFKDHPIFGIGLDLGYKFLPHYYELIGATYNQIGHAHNTYLQFLATGGIVCFVAFVAMNAKFIQSTFIGRRPKNLHQYLLIGTAGSIVSFLVGGLSECNYIDSEVRFNYLFYLVVAATIISKLKRGTNESNASIL